MPTRQPLQEHRPREATKAMIIELLMTAQKPLSRKEIADAIDRRKSLNITSLIDELVETGVVVRGVRQYHNGVRGYEYWWKR